jgi:hypothetical protein
MVTRGFWLASVAALLLLSCKKPPAGTFTPDRYVHPEYPYEVRYLYDGPQNILGAEWRLDNYVWKDGVPTKQKEGNLVTRRYDINDDGDEDASDRDYEYDLLLEHRNKDATIWFRNVVISNHDRDKELSVFADNYVEAASGTRGIAVSFGSGALGAGKHFASRVVSRAACSVSGIPAYRVDFEVANVDQLQLTPDARWIRQRVVLVRAPFEHSIEHLQMKDQLPVLLVAGLSSAPEDFDRLAKHLDLLLDRVVIGDSKQAAQHAAAVPQTCRVAPAAPAAPSTSASTAAPAPSDAPAVPPTDGSAPAASASVAPAASPAPAASASTAPAPAAPGKAAPGPAASGKAAPGPAASGKGAPPTSAAPVKPAAPGAGNP